MKPIKTIWHSALGKILISFFGLLLLLSTLTIIPLITYFSGHEVTIRVANVAEDSLRDPQFNYVQPGLVGLTDVDESLLDAPLTDVYGDGDSFFSVLNQQTVYALLDDAQIATVTRVTVERPENDVPYLIVDDIYGRYDMERTEDYYDETGEWRQFYDGVELNFSNLLNAIRNRVPDLNDQLSDGPVEITVRVWRGRFVIVTP